MEEGKKRLGKGLLELLGEEVKKRQSLKDQEEDDKQEDSVLEKKQIVSDDVNQQENLVPQKNEGIGDKVTLLAIDCIIPNPDQPRKFFDIEHLKELSYSISENGIIQPIVVMPAEQAGYYIIIAGERRWRAAQLANLHEIPVIIKPNDIKNVLELALIENIQRVDLNPIEEAIAFQTLIQQYNYTQLELSHRLGKSRSYVANALRLLDLNADIKKYIQEGVLSAGHGRILLMSQNPDNLAARAIAESMSVRQLEEEVKKQDRREKGFTKPDAYLKNDPVKNSDTLALEADLTAALGLKVTINHNKIGSGGTISLVYESLDQLDEICKRLCQAAP